MKHINKQPILPVLIITILGFALRMWAAMYQPVFIDEAYTITEAKFYAISEWDRSYPPLYSLLLHGLTALSTDLVWVRLFNVAAGTLSILALWFLLKHVFSEKTARIGSLLLATSALHTHYSWLARPYALSVLCVIISLGLLYIIQRSIAKKRIPPTTLLICYMFINSIGAGIDYTYSLFLLTSFAGMGIYIAATHQWAHIYKSKHVYIPILLFHSILPVAQYMYILTDIQHLVRLASWIPPYTFTNIIGSFLTVINSSGHIAGGLLVSIQSPLYAVAFLLTLFYVLSYREIQKKSPLIGYMHVSAVIIYITAAGALFRMFDITIIQPRLMLFLHVLFLIGQTTILSRILEKKQAKGHVPYIYYGLVLYFLIMNLQSFWILNLKPYYDHPEDIRAMQALQARHIPVFIFPTDTIYTLNYIWGMQEPVHPELKAVKHIHWLPADAPESAIRPITQNISQHLIIRYTTLELNAKEQTAFRMLSRRCLKKTYKDIEVYDCK